MGAELDAPEESELLVDGDVRPVVSAHEEMTAVAPWLDSETAALVRAIIVTVVQRHTELRAAILYGSVARHEERPLDDPEPSDVDLLLLFEVAPGSTRLAPEQHLAINHSIGIAEQAHLHAPREVQSLPVVWNLPGWDATFVESVARDGILLWARGGLPPALADVASRSPARVAGETRSHHQ
jgi:hypothetical protein